MMSTTNRKLRVFLCHASQDKPVVRELYQRLLAEGWMNPWLDEEKLIAGQNWDMEIEKAVETSDAVIVCLSNHSVTKEGYIQKELKTIVKQALEKPEGVIFIIPLRLEKCPVPHSLEQYQYQDYFPPSNRNGSYQRLIVALKSRAESLEISTQITPVDFYKFILIPPQNRTPPFWIAKYPVTNGQYERFLNSPDYADKELWVNFPRYDEDCIPEKEDWEEMAWQWYEGRVSELKPRLWNDPEFGIIQRNNPVVSVSWYEANAYCKWLARHWNELPEMEINPEINPAQIRLPTRNEWLNAAGGDEPYRRFPWDPPGKETIDPREKLRRGNFSRQLKGTSPVDTYPEGASPYGVMDMCGNVWEWLANPFLSEESVLNKDEREEGFHKSMGIKGYAMMELRGGSWKEFENLISVGYSRSDLPEGRDYDWGFRIVALNRIYR